MAGNLGNAENEVLPADWIERAKAHAAGRPLKAVRSVGFHVWPACVPIFPQNLQQRRLQVMSPSFPRAIFRRIQIQKTRIADLRFSRFQVSPLQAYKAFLCLSPVASKILPASSYTSQRTRLMRQIEQHNEKRATFADQKRENDDYSYDISLDEDFVTALEYGMPPASGMDIYRSGPPNHTISHHIDPTTRILFYDLLSLQTPPNKLRISTNLSSTRSELVSAYVRLLHANEAEVCSTREEREESLEEEEEEAGGASSSRIESRVQRCGGKAAAVISIRLVFYGAEAIVKGNDLSSLGRFFCLGVTPIGHSRDMGRVRLGNCSLESPGTLEKNSQNCRFAGHAPRLSTLELNELTSLNAIPGLVLSEVASLNAEGKFAAKYRDVERVDLTQRHFCFGVE
ncbi:hypothetical protein KSP39_PZI017854 [Platanthera zijinensis]|uniref:Uncharacterized protein n=1 Tax=Platanthera zijinensis TaxID=2320716 RepID=A0AAP0B632_9ASPA